MTQQNGGPLAREKWMIATAVAGAVQALNAAFCCGEDEVKEAVNADPGYIAVVAQRLSELCGKMQLEDAIAVLQEALTKRIAADEAG